MRRVFRTPLDPEPRSLSTAGLIALVLGVVLGMAVTVHRFVESSARPQPGAVQAGERPGRTEVRALEGARASSLGTSRGGTGSPDAVGPALGCAPAEPAPAREPTSASAFEPAPE